MIYRPPRVLSHVSVVPIYHSFLFSLTCLIYIIYLSCTTREYLYELSISLVYGIFELYFDYIILLSGLLKDVINIPIYCCVIMYT